MKREMQGSGVRIQNERHLIWISSWIRTPGFLIPTLLFFLPSIASSQVIDVLPQATGGDLEGVWVADSSVVRVYVPPDLPDLNLVFSGMVIGRFTVNPDNTYFANYTVEGSGSIDLLGRRSFDLNGVSAAAGRYSILGTDVMVTGLVDSKSVDTVGYSVAGDSLMLLLSFRESLLVKFGYNFILLLPFKKTSVTAGSADFDSNGRVDLDDFFVFAASFGTDRDSPDFDLRFDMNSDGSIDFNDFFIFAEQFGQASET